MAKQRNLGITILVICAAVYTRSAFLAPTKQQLRDPNVARAARDFRAEDDPEGLLHGLRYYVLGVGVIGLLIALEDFLMDRSAKWQPDTASDSTPSDAPRDRGGSSEG